MAKNHFVRTGGQEWVTSFYDYGKPTGNVMYVHSSGTATGPGYSPETPISTIDAAVGLCTADNGDVIVVMEDHAETLAAAAAIALDVAGVKILGLGEGRRRPVITFDTDVAASLDVSAARCVLENLVLVNAIDAQTAMVNVTAADCVIKDCEFMLGDATTQTLLGVLTSASANRMIVRNCHMHGAVTAGVSAPIRIVGGDAILIEDNVIVGAFATTGAIENITTACTMITMRRNCLLNTTADGNNVLVKMVSTSTGLLAQNYGGIIDSTTPTPVAFAAGYVAGNYFSSAAGVTASVLM